MVGSVERIEQDIAALQKATDAIAAEFHAAYSAYLTALGQAVRQQLILASYHVCTQGYPNAFLQLPYSQRQQLQQTLQKLAQQVQEELLAQLHLPTVPENDGAEALLMELLTNEGEESSSALGSDALPTAVIPAKTPHSQPIALMPVHLAQWRETLEHAIVTELRTASHAANRILQQAGVLPQTLPEPVLEAATKTQLSDARARTPNLLNLLVGADGDASSDEDADEETEHSVIHIVAVYLRLIEIEFADPMVAAARSKIRTLFSRLKTLGREYQKKQRDRAIAEAQAAWRSSWTEE